MKLVGFNFNKISAEKIKDISGNVKFNTKIDFSSIEPVKSDLLRNKEEILKINFSYIVSYDPGFFKLDFSGDMFLSVDPKAAKDILKGWKDKKTSEDFRIAILNLILRKSNIKALQLEEELGLPPHIPLPTLNKENFKDNKGSSN